MDFDFLSTILSIFVIFHPTTVYAQPLMPAVLLRVAECESGSKQFLPNGKLVRDGVTGTHVGLFQESLGWQASSTANGYGDIKTTDGNIAWAIHLYEVQGLRPWLASKDCWGKYFDDKGKPRGGNSE